MTCAEPLLSSVVFSDDLRIEFCRLDVDFDIPLEAARQCLSSEEAARAARFKFARDAERYIRGRGFMRTVLGHELRMAPEHVLLADGPQGKPHLSGDRLCHFNLSHSGNLAVLAVRKSGPVGVDLELADRALDPMSLAESCFRPHEINALLACATPEAQRATFFNFWTAKEALMKLTGLGMALEPKSISLDLHNGLAAGFSEPSIYRPVTLLCRRDAAHYHFSLAYG